MSKWVQVHVKTKIIGSEVTISTPYTPDEWDEMDGDEREDAINEAVWSGIDVWTSGENGQ